MARGNKQGISAQKKVHKVFLDNPWSPHWPTLTSEQEQLIAEELERLSKKDPQDKGVKIDRKECVLGLNAVTRALEKGHLSAVLLAGGIKPTHLLQHVVPLCASRSVPVVCLRQLNTEIAKKLNISSLAVLGIKSSAEESSSSLNGLLLLIQRLVPPLPSHLKNMYCKSAIKAEPKPPEKPRYPKPTVGVNVSRPPAVPTFLSLSTSDCIVPLIVVPSELNTLSIHITDPNLDLESEVTPTLESKGPAVKRKKVKKESTDTILVPAKLKLLQSSGRKQKTTKAKKAKKT